MTIAKNKTVASLIVLFLMFAIAASLVVLPTVNAAVNYYTSFIYVLAAPSLVGVNQQVLLCTWTAEMPPDIGETAAGIAGLRQAWYNVGINVTKPNGSTETLIIERTDPVGAGYVTYTPETVGTYYAQAIFPEVWKNTTTTQSHYSAAVSAKVEFTVQQEPIQAFQEAPLPTGYWTRPISDLNRDWWEVTGNWLGGAAQQNGPTTKFGFGPGPESAHVLWTKPLWEGGIMDYRTGATGFATFHYQGLAFSPIILNGKLYYDAQYTAHTRRGWYCVDLYTGETLYYENNTLDNMAKPSFAQIYNYESPNQHGGFPYLWRTSGVTIINPGGINGTVWELLDGYTGNSITKIANVTSGGTAVYGKDGSILRYNIVNLGTTAAPNYYLQAWNSSATPSLLAGTSGTNAWQWRPAGRAVHDGSKGFSLNVSLPSILGPRNALLNQTGTIRAVREDEYVIVGTTGRNDERGIVPGYLMAISLERGQEGTKLWDTTFTPPSSAGNLTIQMPAGGFSPEDGVFSFSCDQTLQRWGYSMDTGKQLWESEPEIAMNFYSIKWPDMGPSQLVYQGKLISCGYGGVLTAYNIATGEIMWNYTAKTEGFESPYGNYPMSIGAIADGKIYIGTGEHSPTQPLYRGSVLQCINASNGALLWNFPVYGAYLAGGNSGNDFAIADGRLLALNAYDNQIYCFGKGPSATTVTASPKVSVHGTSVMIEGTVTDQSPSGRHNTNDLIDFTLKGTPAISDEDMKAWMQYMFMQQAIPANAKGVEVSLDTVDPNGNYVHIGTVTTDITGAYGYKWTPEVPGTYQIIATFAGSAAYGPSFAQTYVGVDEAPQATAPPEYPQPIDNTMTIIAVGIAIIVVLLIAIVLIGIWTKRR
jgi:hypothetical protein